MNLDVKELKKLINKKTKAIIPVHMLGASCNMREIIKISKIHNIPILEDNCEAVGGKYDNKYLGTIGDIGVFSFDHGKIITTGEGGMILTNKKNMMIIVDNIMTMDMKIIRNYQEVEIQEKFLVLTIE